MNKYFLYAAAALLIVACTVQTEEPTEEPPDVVPVTGITLNHPDAFLLVGHMLSLDAVVDPDSATNKTVKWNTDDTRIATVNSEGKLTAVSPGTAMITVTTDDGGFTATCAVSVYATGVITMTTISSEVSLIMMFNGADDITINWGDGGKSNRRDYTINSGRYEYKHSYSHEDAHHITITGNTIETLFCSFNKLTILDVSRYSALGALLCHANQLTTLDLSKNIALRQLRCSYNPLTILDISRNYELIYLDCDHLQLATLDLSKNTSLRYLYCDNNQLATLDVSKNTSLVYLMCRYNQLTTSALNVLFEALPDLTDLTSNTKAGPLIPQFPLAIIGNPGASDCDVSIAEKKGWEIYEEEYQGQ